MQFKRLRILVILEVNLCVKKEIFLTSFTLLQRESMKFQSLEKECAKRRVLQGASKLRRDQTLTKDKEFNVMTITL